MKNRIFTYFLFLIILAIMIFCCTSCSKSTIPQHLPAQQNTQAAPINTDCDSLIQAALENIAADTMGLRISLGNTLILDNIRLTQALSDAQKQAATYKHDLINKPTETTIYTGKIKNSFNDIVKNSNNNSEVIKLRNSILIKDSAYANLQAENLALQGKIKQKPTGGSVIGVGNEVNNSKAKGGGVIGDGNTITTKKTSVWPWILLGAACMFILQNVVVRWLKIYFPFLKFIP